MRTRDTPWGTQKAGRPRCRTLCDFGENHEFVHNSFTEFITPNSSFTQAKRWKSARIKTPARHLAVPVEPAPANMVVHGVATPRNRWNDAVTTASRPSGGHEANRHMAAVCRLAASHGPSTDSRQTMRHRHGRILPQARNQIKASLSAFQRWKVKVIRARRESPSKTPKE